MVQKVLGIGLVVLLVGGLIGGGAYLLLQDAGNGGGGGQGGQGQTGAGGSGQGGQGRVAVAGSGQGGSRGNGGTEALVASEGSGYRGGNTVAGSGGQGTGTAAAAAEEWLTVTGVVVAMDEELVVRTADGSEVSFSLGPSWYRDSSGVTIAVGDDVWVTGFYEGEELVAGKVESVSSGQILALRDEGGQPLWSGRGRRGQ